MSSPSSAANEHWQAVGAMVGAAPLTSAGTRPKMEISKALAILGFSTGHCMIAPKAELSQALARQMAKVDKGKKLSVGSDGDSHSSMDARQRDIMVLHEAYQFLSRKYIARAAKHNKAEGVNNTTAVCVEGCSCGCNVGGGSGGDSSCDGGDGGGSDGCGGGGNGGNGFMAALCLLEQQK